MCGARELVNVEPLSSSSEVSSLEFTFNFLKLLYHMQAKSVCDFALLALIVMAVIHYINKQRDNKKEAAREEFRTGCRDPVVPSCKIKETDDSLNDYIWGSLLGKHRVPICDMSPKEADQAMNDHLRVRDITWQESTQQDTVDRINMLYLQGNGDVAKGYGCTKIRDLYDQATKGPTLYDRTCARMPKFDSHVEAEYYDVNGPQNLYLNGKEANYSPEHSANGGPLDKGLYGNDPYVTQYMPLSLYNA